MVQIMKKDLVTSVGDKGVQYLDDGKKKVVLKNDNRDSFDKLVMPAVEVKSKVDAQFSKLPFHQL